MLFSFEDLRVAFQSHVLENGRDCLESGRVASPEVQRNGELITSLIQGVGKHPHRVYVRTQASAESDVLIRGECSCGQRSNCQHVAAVLLKVLADEQELGGEELDLEQLSRLPAAPSDDYPPSVHQRLLYLLFPGADNSSGMEVVTVGARRLQEGGYGSSRVYEPGWASSGKPPRFLLAMDRELLVELDRLEPDRGTGRRPLEGRSGAHLLGRMLQTQRCFLEGCEVELRPGPSRHSSLQWEMDEQGNQFPLVRADSPAARVFLLDSPWYVDPSSRECGQLETGLPAALLKTLIDIQPVAPDQVDGVQAFLVRRFPGGALPPLRRLTLEQRGLLRPVPCLHFTTQEEEGIWPVETDGALLSFDYLGIRLGGQQAPQVLLGKTVQALAHLLLEKEQGRADRPSLVVAPTSLMGNWRREAHQFTPDLRVLTLHGPRRREQFAAITDHDLVLTTYPLLVRDRQTLLAHDYHLLILDEAQIIKNPGAQASRMVRELRARQRLCLTGTPMENHLGELWSLFDFLLPGLLGDARQFRRVFRNPVEKAGDTAVAAQLARRVRPFLLRRTKEAVVRELPPKTEIVRSVELEGMQRDLYESIRLAMHERVRRAVADKGLARSRIVILDALLKLRQACCDPRLVKLESARKVLHSVKLEMLLELLPGMLEEGRRVLLFSQFTGMLKLIEARVKEAGIDYVKLTGQTRDRTTPVARFQRAEVPLFLISLKAGGLGLNLIAADTVIHYDPWWNPAVERQATDRAHRIGQENPVFVYKLIAEGTVEEKIQSLQARKQALADSLFDRKEGGGVQWTAADLEALFEPLE